MQSTYADKEIEITADFAQAASPIRYRVLDRDEPGQFSPTVYQVADAQHDPERALELVNDWLDAQT